MLPRGSQIVAAIFLGRVPDVAVVPGGGAVGNVQPAGWTRRWPGIRAGAARRITPATDDLEQDRGLVGVFVP